MIVIQMSEADFKRVVWVLNNQIVQSINNGAYWNDLIKDFEAQKEAQQLGGFFQCAACGEQSVDNLTNQASTVESDRRLTTLSDG